MYIQKSYKGRGDKKNTVQVNDVFFYTFLLYLHHSLLLKYVLYTRITTRHFFIG